MAARQTPFGTFSQVTTCVQCSGEGDIVSDYCRKCGGEGRVRVKKQVSLNVPPWVKTGSTLRLRGDGDAGMRGGPAGDLYVVLSVKVDPEIQREESNLRSKLSIDYTDAILGTVATVINHK